MRVFHCDHCGHLLFFENINCVQCGRALAYVPERRQLLSLDLDTTSGVPNRWTSPLAPHTSFKLCENYTRFNVCNWALSLPDSSALCRACRLTKTIPNLSRAGNDRLWYALEVAKRRLLYTIEHLNLPLRDRFEDPAGLTFEFLGDDVSAPHVVTGHVEGVITINIAEADEAERVKRRLALNEPYRTVLGHFRHEIGHYYWDRLIRDSARLSAFRDLFGDERDDYASATQRYYAEGPRGGWQDRHVSAYATMHPWEDWAETWAHYLHMTDTLETAAAIGVSIEPRREGEPALSAAPNPIADDDVSFDHMLDSWGPITYVLNNLNRGLGIGDAYPFVLSGISIDKLRFVHDTIIRSAETR